MRNANYYLGIADMKLSELYRPTIEERNDMILSAIKQAQIEAIEETVKACAEAARTVKIGNSGSWFDAGVDNQSILDVENQLKAKL